MKAFAARRKPPIFLKFFIPYLLIMMIPFSVGYLAYRQTVELMEDEATQANLTMLDQVRRTLDQRLDELDAIAHQLTTDPRVLSFQQVYAPYEGTAPIRLLETRRSVYDYSLTNRFISNYALLFKNSGIAITPNASFDLSDFYSRIFHYENEPYEAWYSGLMETYYHQRFFPARSAVLEGRTTSVVTYVRSFGYPSMKLGAFVLLIDESQIRKLLEGLQISGGGWAYIADENGTVISSVGSPRIAEGLPPADLSANGSKSFYRTVIDAEKMMITSITSESNGWTYAAAQPLDIVLKKVNYLKRIAAFLLLGALVTGLAFALWMAYRNSFPLRKLVRTLTEQFQTEPRGASDVYVMIQDTLSSLADNNRRLDAEIRRQRPYFRSAVLERLLQGDIGSEPEADSLLEHIGTPLSGGRYAVALLQVEGSGEAQGSSRWKELDIKRIRIKDVVTEMLNGLGYIHDLTPDRMALLLYGGAPGTGGISGHRVAAPSPAAGAGGDAAASAEAADSAGEPDGQPPWGPALEQIRAGLLAQHGIGSTIAVGGECAGLLELCRSFREAAVALNAAPVGSDGGLIRFDALPDVTEAYDFPPDMQQRLLNLARAGEKEEGLRLLEELYRTNLQERRLSLSMRRLLLHELRGCVVKIAGRVPKDARQGRIPLHGLESGLDTAEEMERLFPQLLQVYAAICEAASESKKNRNHTLADKIVEYIEAEYTRSDFGVAAAADHFQISENYFSQLFRDQTGATFTDYVLKLRMDHARRLLLETELPIKDIAGAVGYNSMNTFGRAFKRYYGVSASSYRSSS